MVSRGWSRAGVPRWVGLAVSVPHGVGQVVFQGRWPAGLVILAGIAYNSRVYAAACLVGVVSATATALALRADRDRVRSGLYGFNGALLGIGLAAYLNPNLTGGTWPGWRLWVFIITGAAVTAVVTAALTAAGPRIGVPVVTWPFNIVAWGFLLAVPRLAGLRAGPAMHPALPAAAGGTMGGYGWDTVWRGVGNAVAEVFFQNNPVSGYIILAGIAVGSVTAAGMAAAGALAGMGAGMLMGGQAATIGAGLFGYNGVLVAIALGGVFYRTTAAGCAYTIIAAAVSAWVWAGTTVAFTPTGTPALTGPFCIVATLAVLAAPRLPALTPVAPD